MSEGHVEKMVFNANVGVQDQQLAAGLDELRAADEWLLIVPAVLEGQRLAKLLTNATPFFMAQAAQALELALDTIRLALAERDEDEAA